MKKLISLVLCITLILSLDALSACGEEKESYKEIFEKDKIIDVKIDIDEADLEEIRGTKNITRRISPLTE